MLVIEKSITNNELKTIAKVTFGDMIKAVVDSEKEVIAIDAELHSDLEAFLLKTGSKQKNLWGVNLYPEIEGNDFLEFDSMINIRPSQNNRSRGVDNDEIRRKITQIVNKRIKR
ncbi:MAG: DUF5674 family protein [Candidatus Gastranaerophilaceae bacterium]